jgi:PEGA domain
LQPPPAVAAVQPGGRAVLKSRPAGAAVLIDDVARGITPVEIELSAGSHTVVFRSGTGERTVDLAIENGTRVVEDVDMPAAGAATAQIEITSDPASARVALDGRSAGETPIKLHDIAPGHHVVAISEGSATVTRAVDVAAGASASVFVSLAASAAPAGATFSVESPVDLRVLENGQLLGVSNAAPIALAAGKHQFDLVNDALELRLTRSVTIDPGKAARISVTIPSGSLFINASPWADVFVDGRSVGVTPLGNVPVLVGSHDVVFRHPQLGEKQRTVVVGARTPVRVAMDMTR